MGTRKFAEIRLKYPRLHDRDWLYQRYVVDDSGLKAIADEIGCTTSAVTRALGLAGIDIKGKSGPARRWEPTREELIAAYADAGSLTQLARRQGMSQSALRNVFARRQLRPSEIDIVRRGDRPTVFERFPQLADGEWLEKALYEGTTADIAEEIGASVQEVHEAVHEHGIDRAMVAHKNAVPRAVKDRAVRLYLAGNTLPVVARVVRADQSAVFRWLRAAGVDTTQRKPPGWR